MGKTRNYFGHTVVFVNAFLLLTATSNLAQSPLPPPPKSDQDQDVYQFEAPDSTLPPPNSNSSPAAETLFRVQVYGSSEQLLALVRRVEPSAFVRPGENVIQAGLFSETENAQELVRSLSEQGIQADIVEISQSQPNVSLPANDSPREVISLSPATPVETPVEASPDPETELIPIAVESSSPSPEPVFDEQEEENVRGYYVIIPTRQAFLSQTAAMVQAVGVRVELIQKRDAPRGDHVAVGPFSEREEATRWRSQLRGEGLDARVYFGR